MVDKVELIKQALKAIGKDSQIFVSTFTPVALKGGKKNPMQNKVFKQNKDMEIALFGYGKHPEYADFVRAQMIAEGKDPAEFTGGKRAWGEEVRGTPFLKHNDTFYLRYIALASGKVKYFHKLDDGTFKEIAKNEIIGLDDKPEEEKPSNPDTTQGKIETKIIVRTNKVENLRSIRVDSGIMLLGAPEVLLEKAQ